MNRRRFRYRLTTLLTIMLAISIAAACYGNHLRALKQQDEAFLRIAAKGGWVTYYEEGTSVGFGTPPWKAPRSFLCGTGLRAVYEPEIDGCDFSDQDTSLLENIIKLRRVDFTTSRVSRAAQDRFKQLHARCQIRP